MSDTNGRANGHANGHGESAIEPAAPPLQAPPAEIAELAEACVRFVERKLGVRLDYTLETLPVLDHYLADARAEVVVKPEVLSLVVNAAGAYFGEVVRRRIPSWWHVPGPDPAEWQICAEPVYLWFSPVAMAYDAVMHGESDDAAVAKLEIEEEDREALEARLAELPQVCEDEFYALSTRLEVIDIAADVIKARMVQNGLGDVTFGPADYEE
jgi:hypothetical protein